MEIIRTTKLTDQQLSDLHRLETACRTSDQTNLTFPVEEENLTFLLYDEDTLLSVFSAIISENDTFDCCAFTLPSMRRNGFFTRLLEEFLKESSEAELLFTADCSCPDTAAALEAIGAELWYEEHMMELELNSQKQGDPDLAVILSPSGITLSGDTLYTAEQDGRPVGSFHLVLYKDAFYFYGFEINEPLRGKGLGTRVMKHLLNDLTRLPEGAPGKVRLQVNGTNDPALALYRKLGFRTVETVSCYLY